MGRVVRLERGCLGCEGEGLRPGVEGAGAWVEVGLREREGDGGGVDVVIHEVERHGVRGGGLRLQTRPDGVAVEVGLLSVEMSGDVGG